MSTGLRLAIREAGIRSGCDPRRITIEGKKWLADGLGIKAQSINDWKRIPRTRLLMVHHLTGIPLELLEPKLFRTAKSNTATARGNKRP